MMNFIKKNLASNKTIYQKFVKFSLEIFYILTEPLKKLILVLNCCRFLIRNILLAKLSY